jgi:isopenicillin-N epimerase
MTEFGRAFRAHWALDPQVTYLNHGTVGAPPRRVLEAQAALIAEIERQPATFMLRDLTEVRGGGRGRAVPRMREAAAKVAEFLGAQARDLVFVDNATTGVNAVLRSLPLGPDDEILVTDQGYGGVVNAARFVARQRGARLTMLTLPFPVSAPAEILDAIVAGIDASSSSPSGRRVLVVDHVSADTSLLFPIREIASACHVRGVSVLVDGAHAPGAIALDIPSLGVDWYIGNLHKWMWTPRSSGILWAPPERQSELHPVVISWGLDQGFSQEFDLLGTRDPTPHLAASAAIELMREWGVDAIRRWNHDHASRGARRITELWGLEWRTPESMIGTMATVPLPASLGGTRDDAYALRDRLLFEDHIEITILSRKDRLWARLATQIYNDDADVDRLGEAIARRAGE